MGNEIIEVNGREFFILSLLGKGKGGYSYLVSDGEYKYVCKQIHHEPCSYYSFGNKIEAEVRDYHKLKEIGLPLPILFDVDYEKERILKEFIEGPTLYQLVLEDKMQEEYLVQMKKICSVLYSIGLNIDYFPTNFVVNNGKISYIDYECNNYMEEWNFENWGIKYWSKTEEFMKYALEHKS